MGLIYAAILDLEEQFPEKGRIGQSQAIKWNSGKRGMEKIQPYG